MPNNLSAVILAAGRGSRMNESRNNFHKCLTQLGGKSLIDWQISSLQKADITDISVITGYNSHLIKGEFKKFKNHDWHKTNMVSTFFCLPPVDNDLIVTYSDILYSFNHIVDLKNEKGDIVITADKDWFELWSSRFIDPLEDAESLKVGKKNFLLEIGKKEKEISSIEGQFMGLLKFSPKGREKAYKLFMSLDVNTRNKMDMTALLSELIKITKVKVVFVSGKWCEVDNQFDKNLYEIKLKNKKWLHDWRS